MSRAGLTSFSVVSGFTFAFVAFILVIINSAAISSQNNELTVLFGIQSGYDAIVLALWNRINLLNVRITNEFINTASIDASIIAYNAFLDNYTCDQITSINNIVPPCNGTFFIYGAGNITIDNGVLGEIYINGSALKKQLDDDQLIIDFVITTLATVNGELALLNLDAVKTINNVTRDANGNVRFQGVCGMTVTPGNASNSLLISTCAIEQNVTDLINLLINNYTTIQNEIVIINGTIMNYTARLLVDQAYTALLDTQIVKNINGVLPDANNNINITAGPGIAMVSSNGTATVANTGVRFINGLNLNRNVNFVAGPGISIDLINPSTVNVTNTAAELLFQPCANRVISSADTLLFPSGVIGFGVNPFKLVTPAKYTTNALCADTFPLTLGDAFYYQQQDGIWSLHVTLTYSITTFPVTCPTFCAYIIAVGIRDTVTGTVYLMETIYTRMTNALPFSLGTLSGQLTFSSSVLPTGRLFEFVLFNSVTTLVEPFAIFAGDLFEFQATRIG